VTGIFEQKGSSDKHRRRAETTRDNSDDTRPRC
jgi:hypothetical protein